MVPRTMRVIHREHAGRPIRVAWTLEELGTQERALVYQWAVFSPAEIEPPLIEAAMYQQKDPERAGLARGRFDASARAVSDALDGNEFLVGGRLTVADVLIGSALSWPARAGFADMLPDSVKEYVERLSQRPAYQRADARMSG
jgi:glutathione S-transferase